MTLTVLPAVDVVSGQAVRLEKGVAGTEKSYGDPVAAAQEWQDQGAQWLHLVDLDAAFGRGSNFELLKQIVSTVSMQVELTGGIRDDATLERALATGARRVNIGTAALAHPEWIADVIARHGDRVAVDLAASNIGGSWRAMGKGWVDDGGDFWEILERLDAAGVSRVVVTDVSKDGTLAGPNVELLREVSAATDALVTASGGISCLDDLVALSAFSSEGIDSAIVGKALYEGRFTLAEALQVVGGSCRG
ncbi:bifunctional 1-(5-phosphoribosyl)-5-((5-phosphoribosylamino)methylideneamino)imidazole-4-carboxamide isomerase/phosphoribosylanthranilate isomerase PriA [Corynebacterium uberis]|uniref:bifunctional 1-(5-phosphoribosyl)-5-((5- phosphoribosylamino)methylideneamino)imidazole-4- carboxamide isomerase/phosphoribosylanthranilate isomerase PriA n=1 Tax=Corynebacterium TaxID=1716 RepID=UPI001D0AC910|nr:MULTISPECIES: bifunctional 1-(5-phosphoribosyl)-5-((5-phosphoribosylamino)methylideneamino)imidazole-4-carboxamide isomerase/phosphoribosylanthranilate isomerase PriA [Corynebacterium]MCZ9308365.1 bifunctional 1-(5-phosphoribosyl)-5-((5-phosphoribosylamino)methylideneamino)imidazole-4-carboxamide isomerase/phosphoribosylanthranilate isomerase PriA [Corynebacterium sp. c6VSa_13]UDL74036.1 bifunctional 1-(5-phosphoribosyl)-5-((5-phosphoribosylamino)methylideneamino)imidazole-4-carboxamide isomer